MKASIYQKLLQLQHRYDEIQGLLNDPAVMQNNQQFRDLSKEYAKLMEVMTAFSAYREAQEAIEDTKLLLEDPDEQLRSLAELELAELEDKQQTAIHDCQLALLPEDPNDNANVYLEIRAGTGGDEAALFAADLFRMYQRYAESQRWTLEVLSAHLTEQGGYKEVISRIAGKGVYSRLKFESGAHRVQRVPVTESQGRIHTSACTVAVLPEQEAVEEIEINPSDLRIDTFRASGAGGQHVNKTDSAIRLTHIPTGIVVECQEERSQHKNKARALKLLQTKLTQREVEAAQQARSSERRQLVGSGDRSERIRTYNFPQGRMTDHRIQLTLYQLDDILAGQLQHVIDPLMREHQADLLASLQDD